MRPIGIILAVAILLWAITSPVSAADIKTYLAALNDSDSSTRLLAVAALGSTGDPAAIDPIVEAMTKNQADSSNPVYPMALFKLGKTAIDPMLSLLKNEESQIRSTAALVLGSSKDARAIGPLKQSLSDSESNVRQFSAFALGVIGDPQATDALILALKDNESSVRSFAAVALGLIGDEKANEPLSQAIDAEANNSDFQATAKMALESLGKPGGYFITHSLESKNDTVRLSGAFALMLEGDSEQVDSLAKALQDENGLVCLFSAFSLALIADSRSIDPLIKALEDNKSDMREMASIALGFIGEPALESLKQAAKADKNDTRQAAVYAMAIIGKPAEKNLIESLDDEDAKVKLAAVNALGLIGDSQSVEPLKNRISDDNGDVRIAASRAVERLGGFASKSSSIIESLSSDVPSPQKAGKSITWTAETSDSHDASLQLRFKLSGPRTGDEWKVVRDWTSSNTWTWYTSSSDIGESKISVEVRDGKNDGMDGYNDSKISEPYVISDPVSEKSGNKYDKGDCSRSFKVKVILDEAVEPGSLEGFQILVDGDSKGSTNTEGELEITADNGARTISASKKEDNYEYAGSWTGEIECYKPIGGTKEIQIKVASNKGSAGTGQGEAAGSSSAPEVEWEMTLGTEYPDWANSIQETRDGGFIIVGSTYSCGEGGIDTCAILIKTRADGSEEWEKIISELTNNFGEPHFSVQQTRDDGFIIEGEGVDYKSRLIKIGADGSKEWEKILSGKNYEKASAIHETRDGGFIIAGNRQSMAINGTDAWLLKINADCNKEWEKTFAGRGYDSASSVRETSDGGFIVAGRTELSWARQSDIWLIKTSAEGNKEWEKTFGGASVDEACLVQETSDSGFIVTGIKGYDTWLIKTDADGNEEWIKTWGGTDEYMPSVGVTHDDGFIITALIDSHTWLIKTNASGSEEWRKTFRGNRILDAEVTQDGGFIAAGGTGEMPCDVWLVKLKGSGASQEELSDLAVSQEDISYINTESEKAIIVKVHNTGKAEAKDVSVCFSDEQGNHYQKLDLIKPGEAAEVTFADPKGNRFDIAIDPDDKIMEISKDNNKVFVYPACLETSSAYNEFYIYKNFEGSDNIIIKAVLYKYTDNKLSLLKDAEITATVVDSGLTAKAATNALGEAYFDFSKALKQEGTFEIQFEARNLENHYIAPTIKKTISAKVIDTDVELNLAPATDDDIAKPKWANSGSFDLFNDGKTDCFVKKDGNVEAKIKLISGKGSFKNAWVLVDPMGYYRPTLYKLSFGNVESGTTHEDSLDLKVVNGERYAIPEMNLNKGSDRKAAIQTMSIYARNLTPVLYIFLEDNDGKIHRALDQQASKVQIGKSYVFPYSESGVDSNTISYCQGVVGDIPVTVLPDVMDAGYREAVIETLSFEQINKMGKGIRYLSLTVPIADLVIEGINLPDLTNQPASETKMIRGLATWASISSSGVQLLVLLHASKGAVAVSAITSGWVGIGLVVGLELLANHIEYEKRSLDEAYSNDIKFVLTNPLEERKDNGLSVFLYTFTTPPSSLPQASDFIETDFLNTGILKKEITTLTEFLDEKGHIAKTKKTDFAIEPGDFKIVSDGIDGKQWKYKSYIIRHLTSLEGIAIQTTSFISNGLGVSKIDFTGDFHPGGDAKIDVKIDNNMKADKDYSWSISVPKLNKRTEENMKLSKGETDFASWSFKIPDNAEEGEYPVEVKIYENGNRDLVYDECNGYKFYITKSI